MIKSQRGTIVIKLTENPCISETEEAYHNLLPLHTRPHQIKGFKLRVSEY